jgi:uncharacterized protein YndB with AHSA1/START domain
MPTLLLALLMVSPPEGGWKAERAGDGVEISSRAVAGHRVRELRVIGEIEAPPAAVFRVLADTDRYPETMAYVKEARLVAREPDGTLHAYFRVSPPVVSDRDYTLRLVLVGPGEGRTTLEVAWTLSDRGPPPRDGVVRVTLNTGGWRLEPLDGGRRTRATYQLLTDPAGSVPTFAANMANQKALPELFARLRTTARLPRYLKATEPSRSPP